MDLFNYEDELCENCRCYNESSLSLWLDCTGLGLGELVYSGIGRWNFNNLMSTKYCYKTNLLLEARKSSYSLGLCTLLHNYKAEVPGVAGERIIFIENKSFNLKKSNLLSLCYHQGIYGFPQKFQPIRSSCSASHS